MEINNIEPSSFKDPDARVFYNNGECYRKFSEDYLSVYKKFMQCGLYQKLLDKNLIISHKEIENDIIKPEKVFITYPYEWCFSQLKDAALVTLEIQKTALEYDMSLKDATPFNIQFRENKPLLIDTSSFEEYKNAPWTAYRQFCENFLAPLSLMAYTDLSLNSLFLKNLNGVCLELTTKLLPFRAKFNFGLLMHIYMHSKIQNKYSCNETKIKNTNFSKIQQQNILTSLYDTVSNLKLSKYKTEWGEYYSNTNYTGESFEIKKEIIKDFKDRIKPEKVWDFGANTGVFSRIFSNNEIKTAAFDIDAVAVEKNYIQAKQNNEKNIFPLVFDIANPSPPLGFFNRERKDLMQRASGVDLVLALALIHHLRITCHIPFNYMAEYFSAIGRYLIIEYIEKDDSKIQKMLLNRVDIFKDYSKDNFEHEFSKFYNILDKKVIEGTKRVLYLMEKK